jgi:outer membrane receptor protein involved in Fe transport
VSAVVVTAAVMGAAGAAMAQTPAAQTSVPYQLSDVVVTATKQSDSVNRISMSISAETQQALDQKGVKTVQDLGRDTPALTITTNNNSLTPSLTIRGIYSATGAATTGVYLDDIPLTKRQVSGSGGNTNGNGTPVPSLYDLERVEVLRGPQGTLYGSGSEGGTVRFITVQPSLTSFSGQARGETSTTSGGAPSYETDLAIGGPILQDKLGFRLSATHRSQGGYINRVDIYNNLQTLQTAVNWEETSSLHGAMTWAPSARTKVTGSVFAAQSKTGDVNTEYLPQTYAMVNTPICYNTAVAGRAAVACPANAVPGQTVNGIFQRPGYTYGPYNFAPESTAQSFASPSTTRMLVGSLVVDYDLGFAAVKEITSYIHDSTQTNTYDGSQISNFSNSVGAGITGNPYFVGYPTPAQGSAGFFDPTNSRSGLTEEIRLSSPATSRPVSWVAGVYYQHIVGTQTYNNHENLDNLSLALYGKNATQLYGVPMTNSPLGITAAYRYQKLTDTELAGFGEANWFVTDKLKLTGGLRYSSTQFKFVQVFYGPVSGFNVPSKANGGLTNGSQKETPLTPKVAATYSFTPSNLVYFEAAKGFRPGGVNGPLSPILCVGLGQQGLTPDDLPTTYNSDTVMSYETGAKLRLFDNRLQVNASAFKVDWNNVQVQVSTVGCGQTYVKNAGTASSQGGEVSGQALLGSGFSLEYSVGYDDAHYTQTALGPTPKNGAAATTLVHAGDTFPVPVWTGNLGLSYKFDLAQRPSYARVDWQYQGGYLRTLGPGVNSYAPDVRSASSVTTINARLGIQLGQAELNVFARNLLDTRTLLTEAGGRGGCAVATGAACTTYTSYGVFTGNSQRPREIGAQVTYKF